MSDRKYRQHGYQDSGNRERRPASPRPAPEPRDPRMPRDPQAPNVPGFRQVTRCARCGHLGTPSIEADTRCAKCAVDLHTCINCGSFDAGARFECTEPIPARVSPKDLRNACTFFSARVSVERETGSTPPSGGMSHARKAFDDLFKI